MPSSAGGAEVSPSMALAKEGVARERVYFTPHPKTLTGGGEYDSFAVRSSGLMGDTRQSSCSITMPLLRRVLASVHLKQGHGFIF